MSCIIEKYNGFQVISIEYARKQRKNFTPIDIIYSPTKHPEIEPFHYFTAIFQKATLTCIQSKILKKCLRLLRTLLPS